MTRSETRPLRPKQLSAITQVLGLVDGFAPYLCACSAVRALAKCLGVLLALTCALLLEALVAGEPDRATSLVMPLLCLAAGCVVASYADTYLSHDVSFKIVAQLREKVTAHVAAVAPGGLVGIDTANTAVLVISDVGVFEWFFAHCLVEWAGTAVALLLGLSLVAQRSPTACLVLAVALAIIALSPLLTVDRAKRRGLAMKELFGRLNGVIADAVWGIKDVIGFCWEPALLSRMEQATAAYDHQHASYARRGAWEKALQALLALAGTVIAVLVALSQADAGQVALALSAASPATPSPSVTHPSGIIVVGALGMALTDCVLDTLAEGTNYGFVFGAAQRLCQVLDIPAPVEDSGTLGVEDVLGKGALGNGELGNGAHGSDALGEGAPTDASACHVSFRDVRFAYPTDPQREVLAGLSFEAEPGQVTALVGASGGGKSTAARLLQRLFDADGGSVCLNGVDVRDLRLDSLRELVTVVPQDVCLVSGSVADNLRLACPDATDEALWAALRAAGADGFVSILDQGIDTPIDENAASLSGGERQRLGLAQAFLKASPVLVLDEATSALDTRSERLVDASLRELRAERTTIVIAHRLSTIARADKVVFLRDGKAAAVGTYERLARDNEQFRNLVRGDEYAGSDEA